MRANSIAFQIKSLFATVANKRVPARSALATLRIEHKLGKLDVFMESNRHGAITLFFFDELEKELLPRRVFKYVPDYTEFLDALKPLGNGVKFTDFVTHIPVDKTRRLSEHDDKYYSAEEEEDTFYPAMASSKKKRRKTLRQNAHPKLSLPKGIVNELKALPFISVNNESFGNIVFHENGNTTCTGELVGKKRKRESCATLAARPSVGCSLQFVNASGTEPDIDGMRVSVAHLDEYAVNGAITFHVHPYVCTRHSRYIMFWGPSKADIAVCASKFANKEWKSHITVDGMGIWVIEPTPMFNKVKWTKKKLQELENALGRYLDEDTAVDPKHPAYARLSGAIKALNKISDEYGVRAVLLDPSL